MEKKGRGSIGLRRSPWRIVAVILIVLLASFAGTHFSEAQVQTFANKGFLFDPGGAPSQMATPYYVGAVKTGYSNPYTIYEVAIWNSSGTQVFATSGTVLDGETMAMNPNFATGSAVYFNDLVYVFVPMIPTVVQPPSTWKNMLQIMAVDPSTWTVKTLFEGIYSSGNVANSFGKNGVGAVVANGAIYAFMQGANNMPQVVSSADGENWAVVTTANTPSYPVIHDAITFIDPTDGTTKIMVVVGKSDYPSAYPSSLPAVTIFDPTTAAWGPVSVMPQGSLPYPWGFYASAWFGSLSMKVERAILPFTPLVCNEYSWNSGGTNAYLHILGVVSGQGGIDYLAHWYLDPTTLTWTFDPSGCAPEAQGIVWAAGCTNLSIHNPLPLGPIYQQWDASGCSSGNDCLMQQMGALSCGFLMPPFPLDTFPIQWPTPNSDLWVPGPIWNGKGFTPGPLVYNAVDTQNPQDPAFGNDPNVYQAVAGMVRIHGIIMGPPPFPLDPGWQKNADWEKVSNITLGTSSSTSTSTSSTFSRSYTEGTQAHMSTPVLDIHSSTSFTEGYSMTHEKSAEILMTYDRTVGTQIEGDLATLGQQGWAAGLFPLIQPMAYVATSVNDPGPTGTYMGYTQMLLNVSQAMPGFQPYNLTNPADISYTVGFLLTGMQGLPPSTAIDSWNINMGGTVQNWCIPPYQKGDWYVIGGATDCGTFTIPYLSMGTEEYAKFVTTKTTTDTWSKNFSTDHSTSLKFGSNFDSVTTSMDLSWGWETGGSSSQSIGTDMEADYKVPVFTGGYNEIYVQPYLLQATTYNAPWVPKGYKGPLPWAITWDVTNATKPPAMLGAPETVYARTTMPEKAFGRITGTAGPNDPSAKTPALIITKTRDDTYAIRKGQLSYIGPDKSLIPVAMTADDFSPSTGIVITINGYKLYATSAKGTWRRSGTAKNPGNVWTYASRYGTERLNVTLGFGSKTWDMAVSRVELGDRFAGITDTVNITLDLNGRYVLSTRIVHNIAYEWEADLSSFTQAMEMEMINVKYGFSGPGKVTVKGRITDQVRAIGDASLVLNESRKDYKLMNTPHFVEKVEKKQPVSYKDDTGTLSANLKTGRWTITADDAAFPNPRPMYHGEAELKVKVAGRDYFSAYVHPDSYVLDLSYELLR